MTKEEYFEKAKSIWQNEVPKSGQAAHVQGELLRAIEKLREEAQRNANANFNEKCHQILIGFLREKLTDQSIFSESQLIQIKSDLDQMGTTDRPYLDDDIYDRLCERIVDWCIFQKKPIPHSHNEELNC